MVNLRQNQVSVASILLLLAGDNDNALLKTKHWKRKRSLSKAPCMLGVSVSVLHVALKSAG